MYVCTHPKTWIVVKSDRVCIFWNGPNFLRHIRVNSKKELKNRIMQGIEEIGFVPVVYRWKKFKKNWYEISSSPRSIWEHSQFVLILLTAQQGSFLTIPKGSSPYFPWISAKEIPAPSASPALRSGDAVSPRLKSSKITGLSPNHGQITTLLDRLQFVENKPGMLPSILS